MPNATPMEPDWIDDQTVRVVCPAKINFALSVGPPREDGMHPIASWMVPIDLCDTLTLRRATQAGEPDTFDIAFAADAPAPQPIDWPLTSDLAYRAFDALERVANRELPVHTTLEKRIPAGAGLGGGSADAAGMIVGLNALFGLKMKGPAMMEVASSLGSDVMFQLAARQTTGGAIVTGTGEQIELLPTQPPTTLLLVLPPFGCSTPEVYRAFDTTLDPDSPEPADPRRVGQLARATAGPHMRCFNDLAKAACVVQPGLHQVLDQLSALGLSPYITGSGSAVFCVLDPGSAKRDTHTLLQQVRQATGCAALTTRTLG
ncbi:MAG: 4-(cytidine 5'-diphospho)-2-C-methyl-D-erythritol kinase [Phycisphaerales bacterium JB063]